MATVELAAFLAGAHLDILEDVAMETPFAGQIRSVLT